MEIKHSLTHFGNLYRQAHIWFIFPKKGKFWFNYCKLTYFRERFSLTSRKITQYKSL